MKVLLLLVLTLTNFLVSVFAATPDFSGNWVFNVTKSKNPGMMADMQITLKIKQTPPEIVVFELARFNGQDQTRQIHYDLSGKHVANNGPMGDPNDTVSKWKGSSIETTWIQEGAIAGSKVVRIETRSLSQDGKTMTDRFVRESKPPLVMVFDKQ
jgi:hypothetical protein